MLYPSREGLRIVDRSLQFLQFCLAASDSVSLGFQLRQSLLCSMNPWLEFFSFQEAFLIGVDQASDPSSHATDQPHELIGGTS
jgi:hypothetical protein